MHTERLKPNRFARRSPPFQSPNLHGLRASVITPMQETAIRDVR
jgi:hypothetical protein